MRKISDFIVGEQRGPAAFHRTWISNPLAGWKFLSAFASSLYLFTQFRVCVMWQVVLGVAGFIRETSLECVLRT